MHTHHTYTHIHIYTHTHTSQTDISHTHTYTHDDFSNIYPFQVTYFTEASHTGEWESHRPTQGHHRVSPPEQPDPGHKQ